MYHRDFNVNEFSKHTKYINTHLIFLCFPVGQAPNQKLTWLIFYLRSFLKDNLKDIITFFFLSNQDVSLYFTMY